MLVGRQVRARLDSLAIHSREIICGGSDSALCEDSPAESEPLRGDDALSLIEVTSTQVLRLAVGVGWLNQAIEKRSGIPSAGMGVGSTTYAEEKDPSQGTDSERVSESECGAVPDAAST